MSWTGNKMLKKVQIPDDEFTNFLKLINLMNMLNLQDTSEAFLKEMNDKYGNKKDDKKRGEH
jgi:hypothetical protein